jgi:hypothetical protein
MALPSPDHEGRHARGHQQPRHHAGQEQLGDRLLGDHAPDHEGDGRRNERREHAGAHAQGGGVGFGIAALGHRGDHHRADGGCGGRCGAAHRSEDHGSEDRHEAKAAGQVTHEDIRHVDEAPREPACSHHLAGEHEEWNRQQAEALGARFYCGNETDAR